MRTPAEVTRTGAGPEEGKKVGIDCWKAVMNGWAIDEWTTIRSVAIHTWPLWQDVSLKIRKG